jgi:hypothetical protein
MGGPAMRAMNFDGAADDRLRQRIIVFGIFNSILFSVFSVPRCPLKPLNHREAAGRLTEAR